MIQDDNNINISYLDRSNGFLRGLDTRKEVPVPYSVNGYEEKVAEDNARLAAEEELLRQRYMESTFRDDAGSPKGARGAYQIMPGTHREYVAATGKDGDLNDYSYNKAVRDWYMSRLSKSRTITNGNPTDEVRKAKLYAAYNWGQGNLGDFLQRKKEAGVDIYHSLDWVNDLPDETRNYVNFIVFGKDIEGTDKTIEAMNRLLGRDSSAVAPPPVPDNTPQQPLFFDAETGRAVVIPQGATMNSYGDGGGVSKVAAIAKRINETSQSDFVKRLIDKRRKVINNPDGTVSTHELGYVDDGKGNAVVFPEVQSSGDSLKRFPFPASYDRAVERGDTVHMSVPDAELFTKEYKSVYPGFNSYEPGGKIKTKKGDSWIKIANDNGISLNDLLYWNGIDPTSKEELPMLHAGSEVYVSNPYRLNPSVVSADAPDDYVEFGDIGRETIDAYAAALHQHKIALDRVPEVYRTAALQRYTTMSTDKAADVIAKVGLNTAAALADPVGYLLSWTAQKGLAYANDKVSGRNEYDKSDILKYTPIRGTEYSEEHPLRSAALDVASGIAGGTAMRNIPNVISHMDDILQNASFMSGIDRDVVKYPIVGKSSSGTSYTSGIKGYGKTGSQYAGRIGGYRQVSSPKGTFAHSYSSVPGNITMVSPSPAVLPAGTVPFSGVTGPILWRDPSEPNVSVRTPEKRHILEKQSFNRWQGPNPSGETVPFKSGTGIFSVVGHAPFGSRVLEQPLIDEFTTVIPDAYVPRTAVSVPGNIEGTPLDIYSGLGILYGSDNPGSLVIDKKKSKSEK